MPLDSPIESGNDKWSIFEAEPDPYGVDFTNNYQTPKFMNQSFKSLIISFFVSVSIFSPLFVLAKIPNDPQYANQWHFDSINAPAAWEKSIGSKKVIVAVLDSGVEAAHPDLAENIWRNLDEVPYNGVDDDKNGYIDDAIGWDFIDNDANPGPDLAGKDNQAGLQHGTIIAGLIGAAGNNGTDGAGVNWQVQIMPLRVLSIEGEGSPSDVVKGIDYAIAKGASVINLSFVSGLGETLTENFYQAIQRAYEAGIVIVAAAGNDALGGGLIDGDLDFSPRYPVCYDGPQGEPWWIIGVAALDKDDRKAPFSAYGFRCIDLSAPGAGIQSTLVFHPGDSELAQSFGGKWSGTSLAAPLVAGAAALLKSVRPDLSPKQIYDLLIKSADNIETKNFEYLGQLGAGKLNIAKAVEMIDVLFPQPSKPEYALKDLPKKVRLFYNNYKGKVAVAKFDVDKDGKEEWLTAKQVKNTTVYIWTKKGKLKKKIKIKGKFEYAQDAYFR